MSLPQLEKGQGPGRREDLDILVFSKLQEMLVSADDDACPSSHRAFQVAVVCWITLD